MKHQPAPAHAARAGQAAQAEQDAAAAPAQAGPAADGSVDPGAGPADPGAGPAVRIGRRVTELRRERGLSLSELAARAGIGKATLSGVEAGTRNPTLETLYAITGQLGLPLAAVLAEPAARRPAPGFADVHGEAVTAHLNAVFDEPTATFEFYRLRIRPGRRQTSPAHAAGVTEHLSVFSGRGLAGPAHAPIPLAPGVYATWQADRPHVFEAAEEVVAALVIRSPRLG
jgi:transcriptional regulator with XRE-family HTH domain